MSLRKRGKKQDRQSQAGLKYPKTSLELNINIHKNQLRNLYYQCDISSSTGF